MSIRFRLTIAAIAVILVANSLLSFLALQYLGRVWMGEVQTRVWRNLNSARAAYQSHAEVIAAFLRATARDRTLVAAVTGNDRPILEAMLHDLDASRTVDFVGLVDAGGKVICRAGSRQNGEDLSADPLVAQVLRQHRAAHGTLVLSHPRLLAEGPDLADRAAIGIIPTEAARPTTDLVRTDGMVTAAAVPVIDDARTDAGNPLRRRFAQPALRNRRRDQAAGVSRRGLPGQGNWHGNHLPGRLADLDQRQARRRLAGGWHSVEQFSLRCGPGARRDLGRPGIRGQRLVHHGL